MAPHSSLASRRGIGIGTILPVAAPMLAAPLAGLLAFRVFSALSAAHAQDTPAAVFPGLVAQAVAYAAARPAIPAAVAAALPLAAWLAAGAWGAAAPGVSLVRARRSVGWVWLVSVVASAAALLGTGGGAAAGLAALGYALSWPTLGSLAVALSLRRAGALAFATALTGAALVGLLARALPVGWPGESAWSWWAMLPRRSSGELLAGAAWCVGAWLWMLSLSRLQSRWPRRWALAGLVLVPLLLTRGLAHFDAYGPVKPAAALASETNTGFFQVASTIRSEPDFVRRFGSLADQFPARAATHPPGWPLLFRTAASIGATAPGAGAARGVAWLLGADPAEARTVASDVARRPLTDGESSALWLLAGLLLVSLMALPAAVYFAARAHEAPRIAFRAAGLAALLAAPLVLFPDVDVFYPALAVLAAGAWLRSERRSSFSWALLAGLCLVALVALSYGNLALLGVLALQSLLSWRRRQARLGLELRRLAALMLPLVTGLVVAGAAGHDVGGSLWAALARHRDALAHRTWGLWLVLNPLDFLMLMSLPAAAWLFRATPWWHHPGAARRLRMDPEAALFGGALLSLVALDISGVTKGEAGRSWSCYMPLLVTGGAALWRERRRLEWGCVTGLCLLMAVVLKGFYVFVWLVSS